MPPSPVPEDAAASPSGSGGSDKNFGKGVLAVVKKGFEAQAEGTMWLFEVGVTLTFCADLVATFNTTKGAYDLTNGVRTLVEGRARVQASGASKSAQLRSSCSAQPACPPGPRHASM